MVGFGKLMQNNRAAKPSAVCPACNGDLPGRSC
ncbi:hypothetical protein BH09PLA1_BH09PLA1_22500 [soil metagenome]